MQFYKKAVLIIIIGLENALLDSKTIYIIIKKLWKYKR